MLLVIEFASVVLSLLAACSTSSTFPLMPPARLLMKSGIQLCISARGHSSGTEKCRKDRILLATELTASTTAPILLLIPDTTLLIISEPQENSWEPRFLMKLTTLLKPFVMVDLMPPMVLAIPLFTLFQIRHCS